MSKLNIKDRINFFIQFKKKLDADENFDAFIDKMKSYKDEESTETVLDLAIIGIHLMVIYQRHHSFNRRLAETIIRDTRKRLEILSLISPDEIGTMWSSYYLALSKIEKIHANFWKARMYASCSFGKEGSISDKSELFSIGYYQLRMGFGDAAINSFEKAMSATSETVSQRAAVLLANAARLCGKSELSLKLLDTLLAQKLTDPAVALDAKWEIALLRYGEENDISVFPKLVELDQPHHLPSYILEAKLLTLSSPKGSDHCEMPRLLTLSRNSASTLNSAGPLYKCLFQLDRASDEQRSFSERLKFMGEGLQMCEGLTSVEQAQRFLVVSARWFQSNKYFDFATLCLLRYRQISRSLTSDRDNDHLGIASNFYLKKWFKNRSVRPVEQSTSQR